MKVGNIVRLKKKAVRDFYGTDEYPLFYVIRDDISTMTSDQFAQYVEAVLSFRDGNYGAIVVGLDGYGQAWVKYISILTGELQTGIFNISDLEVVME